MQLLLGLILNLLFTSTVAALPIYRSMVSSKKGMLVNCTLCHDKESWELNGYGKDFLKQGHDFRAIESIEPLDSDKDGVVNLEEWKALSNPGDPGSRPGRSGPWLTDAKPTLAPKKILTPIFSQRSKFQVKEGLLADDIILSVEKILGRKLKDEEIYPTLFWVVKEDQILGVAAYSIFPSSHHGLSVVLTITQDKKILKIHPIHLHSKKLAQGNVLNQFIGKSANELEGLAAPKGLENEFKEMKESIRTTLLTLERCQL